MQNIVRELRTQCDMTQEELARLTGVSRQTIVSIERGKFNPSILLAHRISRCFGRRIEDVFLCDDRPGQGNFQDDAEREKPNQRR